jgi:pimeloyl-ACP methyl ester carboxylesterase
MITLAPIILICENNTLGGSAVTTTEHPIDVWSGPTRLTGTVALPASSGPHPGALLLSGSGPLDRDSNTKRMRLDVSKTVAAGLLSQGIASLRYDKRGVGQSGGDYMSAGFDDETADARAALDALRANPGVDADRVIVIGHSAGATIAMRLATSSMPTAGLVFLAGAAMTGQQVMEWQSRRIAATLSRSRQARRFERRQARNRAQLLGTTTDTTRLGWVRWNARWLREYMVYDPTDALAAIDRPVLAITGAKDIQVDSGDVARFGQIVTGPFDGDVPADLTHILRRDPGSPSLRAYRAQLRRPVDPWVVERITAWARSQLL